MKTLTEIKKEVRVLKEDVKYVNALLKHTLVGINYYNSLYDNDSYFEEGECNYILTKLKFLHIARIDESNRLIDAKKKLEFAEAQLKKEMERKIEDLKDAKHVKSLTVEETIAELIALF